MSYHGLPAFRRLCLMLMMVFALLHQASVASQPEPVGERWQRLLDKHLASGRFGKSRANALNYAAIAKDEEWKQLLEELAKAVPPEEPNGCKAFWINTYNILAVCVVLRDYPSDSIVEAGTILNPIWKIEAGVVAGKSRTLHEISTEILRPMGDPRIHAALCSMAVSSPDLSPRAFSAENLDSQLDQCMRTFLANPRRGSDYNSKRNILRVSTVFDWFREDFEPHGGIVAYLTPYLDPVVASQFDKKTQLRFLSFNWELTDTALADELSAISLPAVQVAGDQES